VAFQGDIEHDERRVDRDRARVELRRLFVKPNCFQQLIFALAQGAFGKKAKGLELVDFLLSRGADGNVFRRQCFAGWRLRGTPANDYQ